MVSLIIVQAAYGGRSQWSVRLIQFEVQEEADRFLQGEISEVDLQSGQVFTIYPPNARSGRTNEITAHSRHEALSTALTATSDPESDARQQRQISADTPIYLKDPTTGKLELFEP
jgi:hypothetical protein